MRIKSFFFASLLLLGLAFSCKRSATNANTPVIIQELTLEQQSGADCNTADTLARTDCATVSLHWPEVQQGSEGLKKNVSLWAGQFLGDMLNPSPDGNAAANTSLESAAQAFFDNHRQTEKSAMTGGWTTESDFRVLLNDGQYLTLEITGYSFQGGAHGNPSAAVATFEVQSGKQLTWDDLVTDKAAFLALAEQKFREERADIFQPVDGMEPFEFDASNPFVLAQNYGLVPEGIYLHYVPYEVGPYAIGSTPMIVPYGESGALNKVRTTAAIVVPAKETRKVTMAPPAAAVNATAKPAAKPVKASPKQTPKSAPAKPKAATKPAKATTSAAVPTVTLKQNGDMLLNGKSVTDLESLRKQLQAQLLTYSVLPQKVTFNTVGQTGMGMRAEINDVIDESLVGARWVRKKTAIAALNTAVGKKLALTTQLELDEYHIDGTYAYISARPRLTNGAAIDYGRTIYAKDQSAKWFEDGVVGLLRYEKSGWKVLTYTIGTTKAPASAWLKQYGAPKGLFGK